MREAVRMEALVAELKELAGRGFPDEEVVTFLNEVPLHPEEIERYGGFRDDRYARHRIHLDDDFELLLICWKSGQAAPIHGHEGERCWARVERGRLRFTTYREFSSDPVRVVQIGEPVIGGPGSLDIPEDLHQVENLEEFGEDVVTLHLYSKPYHACDVYDSPGGPKRRRELVCDSDHRIG